MMSDTRTSDLRVRGAFGPEVQQGLKKGTLHAYVMSPGNQEGAALDFTVDTVDNTNDSLFSFREMFEEQGWSAHLCRPPQFCGMSRKNPKTGKDERMPLVYNWKLHQFELHYIVCKDAATAAKVGRDQNNNFRMKQPPYMGSAGRGRQPVSTSQSAVTSGSILDILEPNPITGTHSVMALSLDGEQFGREMRHNEQEGRGRSQIRVVAGDYEYASARAGQKVLHSVPTSAEAASADKRGKQQVDALEEPVNGEYLTSDSTLAGIKYDVGRKEAKMTKLEFHKRTGHIGYMRNCDVCMQIRRSLRRVEVKVDPYRETRPGYLFCCDTITWSCDSIEGYRYTTAFRCSATGYCMGFNHGLRSDFATCLRGMLQTARRDKRFKPPCGTYEFMSEVRWDMAGEWGPKHPAVQAVIQEYGIHARYGDPSDVTKRANAEAENLM